MLGIVDIVLNHTANNSEWIVDHPECTYSTDSVPRLWPAWLVDSTLNKVTHEFIKGGVSWGPSAPYVNNEHDMNTVLKEMERRLHSLNLHEHFICDFGKVKG